MRKNKFLTILIFLGCCLLVTGCFKSKNNVTNEITNKVTNEITQKTTIYDITDNINKERINDTEYYHINWDKFIMNNMRKW